MDTSKPKPPEGCAKPARGVIKPEAADAAAGGTSQAVPQEEAMKPLVGYPAPDFETNAYFNGGFDNIRLSDYRGKWVMICFYPGDFTFV